MSIAVPLAIAVNRAWDRHAIVEQLGSRDVNEREQALNQLLHLGPHDAKLIDAATTRLAELRPDAALPTANVMIRLEHADDPAVRDAVAVAARQADTDGFVSLFRWLARDHRDVPTAMTDGAIARYVAEGATENQRDALFQLIDGQRLWTSPPVPPEAYFQRLLSLFDAKEPSARLAMAERLADLPIDMPDLSLGVQLDAWGRLLHDDDAGVRRLAISAVGSLLSLDESGQAYRLLATACEDADPRNATFAQRLLKLWTARDAPPDALPGPPSVITVPTMPAADAEPTDAFWTDVLRALEAAAPGSLELSFDPRMPHLIRPAWFRAAIHPSPDALIDTLGLDDRPALRDHACIVAAERLDPQQLDALLDALLAGADADRQVSGAVLSGLTGRRTDRLTQLTQREDRFIVSRSARLGLWMQGSLPGFEREAVAMLRQPDVPRCTVLLALMQGGQRRAALDTLFGPTTMSDDELTELLGRQRWWWALRHYLPDDAPQLDLWTQADAFAQQLETLRAWYTLHRFAL